MKSPLRVLLMAFLFTLFVATVAAAPVVNNRHLHHVSDVEKEGDIDVALPMTVAEVHNVENGSDLSTPAERAVPSGHNFFVRNLADGNVLPFRANGDVSANEILATRATLDTTTSSSDREFAVTGDAVIQSDDDSDSGLYIDHNSSVVARRTLFELENNGPPQFIFDNSDAGVSWSFSMNGNNHFQLDTGAGGSEFLLLTNGGLHVGSNANRAFDLDGNGNLVLAGTLEVHGVGGCTVGCKTAPKDVDASQVLDNLADVSFTVYETSRVGADENGKDVTYIANHIFPDAVAFNAAFGLGAEGSEAIAPVDLASIALVAAQELYAELQAKDAVIVEQQAQISEQQGQISEQQVQIGEQQGQIEDLTTRMAELEALVQALLDE